MIYTIPTIKKSLLTLMTNHRSSSMRKNNTLSKSHNSFTFSLKPEINNLKHAVPPGYMRLNKYLSEDRGTPLEARELLKILYNIAQLIQSKHSAGQAYGSILSIDNIFISDTVVPNKLSFYLPNYNTFPAKRELQTNDIQQFGDILREILTYPKLYPMKRSQTNTPTNY